MLLITAEHGLFISLKEKKVSEDVFSFASSVQGYLFPTYLSASHKDASKTDYVMEVMGRLQSKRYFFNWLNEIARYPDLYIVSAQVTYCSSD